jgi:hypothetical protein
MYISYLVSVTQKLLELAFQKEVIETSISENGYAWKMLCPVSWKNDAMCSSETLVTNLAALFSHLLVLVLGSILLELITNRMLSEEAYFATH